MSATLEQADRLLRQGQIADAERAFERVLEDDPDNTRALGALALRALRLGRHAEALALARRATTAGPGDALNHLHVGLAHDAVGALRDAADAFGTAVSLRPDFHVARLHGAHALHRLQDPRAALQFARALQDAQRAGRWLDAAGTPGHLRPLVETGLNVVRRDRRDAYARLLEPLTARFGADALRRVHDAVAIYLRDRAPVYPDPRQQPTFLFLPGLAPQPYLDSAALPWVAALEARTDAIRAELRELLPRESARERVFGEDAVERANLRGTRGAPSWTGYYFHRHGEARTEAATACPITAAALDALPLARIREHAPEVLFSVFTPGTHLLPHRGVTNTRLVGHLPLIVPPDCALVVGGETHVWQEGRVVVFDDTYEHEAWNRSDSVRVVLIFDLWHPGLSEAERLSIGALVEAIGDFRHATDAA